MKRIGFTAYRCHPWGWVYTDCSTSWLLFIDCQWCQSPRCGWRKKSFVGESQKRLGAGLCPCRAGTLLRTTFLFISWGGLFWVFVMWVVIPGCCLYNIFGSTVVGLSSLVETHLECPLYKFRTTWWFDYHLFYIRSQLQYQFPYCRYKTAYLTHCKKIFHSLRWCSCCSISMTLWKKTQNIYR